MNGQIQHVVRWWLKDPADPVAPVRFRDAVGRLEAIPGVTGLVIGTPTPITWTSPDQSWDLGFILSFESFEAVTGYMAHPLHKEVVALAGELTARLEVFYLG